MFFLDKTRNGSAKRSRFRLTCPHQYLNLMLLVLQALSQDGLHLLVGVFPSSGHVIYQTFQNHFACFGLFQA
jgi:hypothetical protein